MPSAKDRYAELEDLWASGVMNLLSRGYSRLYLSLMQAVFGNLSEEVERDELIDRLAAQIGEMVEDGSYPRSVSDPVDEAKAVLKTLADDGTRDYPYISDAKDPITGRYMEQLTPRALTAYEVVCRLEKDQSSLSGAAANAVRDLIASLAQDVSEDPAARISRLEEERARIDAEIEDIKAGKPVSSVTPEQAADRLRLVSSIFQGMPGESRQIVFELRQVRNGFNESMRTSESSEKALERYHRDFRAKFKEADQGRRFNDVHQTLYDADVRDRIEADLDIIAASPVVQASGFDVSSIRAVSGDVMEALGSVSRQIAENEGAVSTLMRRRSDVGFTSLLSLVQEIEQKAARASRELGKFSIEATLPEKGLFPTVALRGVTARSKRKAPPLAQGMPLSVSAGIEELEAMGGPLTDQVLAAMAASPVMKGSLVDAAETFSALPRRLRRECEVVGLIIRLVRDGAAEFDGDAQWRCTSLGEPTSWTAPKALIDPEYLEGFKEERDDLAR